MRSEWQLRALVSIWRRTRQKVQAKDKINPSVFLVERLTILWS